MITAHEVSRERWLNAASPGLLTTSANRNLLQPTRDNEIRRSSNIRNTVEEVTKKSQRKHSDAKGKKSRSGGPKGKQKEVANGEEGRAPALKGMLRHHSSASSSAKSDRSQLVDLVVEDETAEDAERVRARKEGGAGWNSAEPKRFVYVYPTGLLKEGLTCDLVELTGRILARTFAKDMNRLWMVQPTMSLSSAKTTRAKRHGNR